MKKIGIFVISTLLVLLLGFSLIMKPMSVKALEDAKLFAKLNVSAEDINSDSVCYDPFYPASLDTNTAGKGTPVPFNQDIQLAGTDGFIVRIKNLDANDVLTRLLIRTTNDGFSATNSVITFYAMDGTKTVSDKPTYRGVTIPASFDGVMVIEWSELVPFQKNGAADDWSIAVPENKLVKGSEGNTAYPTDKLKNFGLYVEKSAAHATVNPIVLSNVYTYSYADSDYTVTKYNNPWGDAGSNDNGGIYKYPIKASTLLEAVGTASTLDSTAVCVDPLDPVAADTNTSGKGGVIGLYSNIYFGDSDGVVFRIKNPMDTELATRIYLETTDGTNGNKNGYTTNEVNATFIDLAGNVTTKQCTGRAVSIIANFDGYMVLSWSQFTAFKYQGTTAWGNATTANQLVKGGEGQKAYPNGIITALSLYVHKASQHTTANINPIVIGDIFGYKADETGYTLIRKHAPINPNASTNAAGNLSIYAYPTTKATYNFTVDGVAALENDNVTITGATQGMEVAYGDRFAMTATPKEGASIVNVTLDGVAYDTANPIINLNTEAQTHTINVVTARETLYSFEMTGSLERVNAKVNNADYAAALNFTENAEVEIELTAKEGFYINKVLVNGVEVALTNNKYTFTITQNTTVSIDAQYTYNEFTNPAAINSALNGDAILFDPGVTTGSNQGGNVFTKKQFTMNGTDGIAFRVKNLESTDYVINTIYVQCTDNYGYSLWNATLKYISLDGTMVETTMTNRQAKVPANFDGYMLIEYSQLVPIRTGGAYFWDKKADSDKLTPENYPEKAFNFFSIYFPKNCPEVNEFVLGSDVYTITYGEGNSVLIKQYLDALSIENNTIAQATSKKNYPAGKTTVTCENTNVTLNMNEFEYANTIAVAPKEGYTIVSATLGEDQLVDDGTGVFKLRIAKAYGATATLTVETSQLVYHNIAVQMSADQANVKVNDADYTALVKLVENSHVVLEISAKEGFILESVNVNGTAVELTEDKYEFDLTQDAQVQVLTTYAYTEYTKVEDANSAFTTSSIVFDPVVTTGDGNQGGTVSFVKQVSLNGADALAFRVKNLEATDYVVNTLFLHLTNNWSYSLMYSNIKWVAMDGTATENSTTFRQFVVPANFDGYMVIEFNELVPVRSGGADYDWSLRQDGKISKANYPTEALQSIGIFFPFIEANKDFNAIVFGTEVYTIYHGETADEVRMFTDALTMTGHTLVAGVSVSNYKVFEATVACENTDVTLSTTKLSYGSTLVITAKDGCTISSAMLGETALTKVSDKEYTIRITDTLPDNVTLTVTTLNVSTVTLTVGDHASTDLTGTTFYVSNTDNTFSFTLTFDDGYELDSVKVNGQDLTVTNNAVSFQVTADSEIVIAAKLSVYTITYNLDGGTNNQNNRATYTIEDSFALLDPTKDGYEFLGWSKEDGEEIMRVAKGSTGNLVLTAHWEAEEPVNPGTQATATQAPATQAPVTQAPATQAPGTQAPNTQAPATQAPATQTPSETGKKKGCKSFVESLPIFALLLVPAAVVVIKRKREE